MLITLIAVSAVLGVTGLGYLLIGGVAYLASKRQDGKTERVRLQ